MRKPTISPVFKTAKIALALLLSLQLQAGEGGSSNYAPGGYGDYGVGIPTDKGWYFADYNMYLDADVDQVVLLDDIHVDVNTWAYINMPAFVYTFNEIESSFNFSLGAFFPFGNIDLEASIASPNPGIPGSSVDKNEWQQGDISLMPASFYWKAGNWHFNLYELVILPTGDYELDSEVSLSRNYASYDTVFAGTHLNLNTGREWSFAAGYMANERNRDTDYDSGNEFHLDLMFNQYMSDEFAWGVHGYYFKQTEGDSGSGALLGSFKGESYGIGPSFLWSPGFGSQFVVAFTWLHDLSATNRLETDYVNLTLGWKL